MRKLLVPILLISICSYSLITFEKTFGNKWNDHANSVIQTSDGGYIFTGCERDSLTYKYTFFTFYKLDKNGVIDWKKRASGYLSYSDYTNEGYSALETEDGGFIISGSLQVWGSMTECTDLFVARTDSQGQVLWDSFFDLESQGYRFGYQIIQTKDNGFIIIGEFKMTLPDFGLTILLKLDSEGQEEWRKCLDNVRESRSIVQTEDKGFAFIGTVRDESNFILQTLVKTDSLCNETWRKTYNGLFSYSLGYSLKQASDGGYIIFGMTDQESYGNLARLIKTDNNGNMLWEKYYGSTENADENSIGRGLDITSDGGYILAGYTENRSTGLSDSWLIKTDSEGNELWTQTYGGEGDDRIYSVQQTSDGGYVLAGYTDSSGAGGKDMWIIKTDENGTEIESPFLPQTTELFQNYPNPFNPVTTISYALSQAGQAELSVFNLNGQLVHSLVNGKQEKGSHKVEFDAGDLTSGLYIYALKVDGKAVQSRKMMLLK